MQNQINNDLNNKVQINRIFINNNENDNQPQSIDLQNSSNNTNNNNNSGTSESSSSPSSCPTPSSSYNLDLNTSQDNLNFSFNNTNSITTTTTKQTTNSLQLPTRKYSINDEEKTRRMNDKTSTTITTISADEVTIKTNNGSPELHRKDYGSLRGSYKQLKENYLKEKNRITNDMLTVMRDERIIVLADWLKIRGTLKNWIKLYVVLKPGIMLLYKSDKMKDNWVGTVLLNSCELLERPSKKHGFCFKLFHPLEKSIWASKGPAGETSLNVFLLPTFYLIFRAQSEKIGTIWMDALELTMKSSNLIKRVLSSTASSNQLALNDQPQQTHLLNTTLTQNNSLNVNTSHFVRNKSDDKLTVCNNQHDGSNQHSPPLLLKRTSLIITNGDNNKENLLYHSDIENDYFKECDDGNMSESEKNTSDDDCGSFNSSIIAASVLEENTIVHTTYSLSPPEEFGELGNKGQTEEVAEENKSLIFCLIKQVRPGMDLSKVILPTFILEPRSFLEKLADFYYHSDLLSDAVRDEDPFDRIKNVVKFYLSGFYKKPKGLKKPYNPILGEMFRCYWHHPNSDSKTFYVAEQVSHHPPITAFYVTNRKEGYCFQGNILARSKFYGNSVSAFMDGRVKLNLLSRGEEYVMTMPYANCKGILIGKLTMELGGKVNIECRKTGYSADIEFKLKPLLGGIEASNLIEGKIKYGKDVVATIGGRWDGEIYLYDKRKNEESLMWHPTRATIESRLKRYIVPLDEQKECESERLWLHVSHAIKQGDQLMATEEKSKIEQRQRDDDVQRKLKEINYATKYFIYDDLNKEWLYNYADLRPWDTASDKFQYENEFKVLTKKTLNAIAAYEAIGESDVMNQNHPSTLASNTHSNGVLVLTTNTNECIVTESESSYALSVQYTNIKHRLDQIETHLNNLNANLSNILVTVKTANTNTASEGNSLFNKNNQSLFVVLLIAWSSALLLVAILIKQFI